MNYGAPTAAAIGTTAAAAVASKALPTKSSHWLIYIIILILAAIAATIAYNVHRRNKK